jgi:hypothetical protein
VAGKTFDIKRVAKNRRHRTYWKRSLNLFGKLKLDVKPSPRCNVSYKKHRMATIERTEIARDQKNIVYTHSCSSTILARHQCHASPNNNSNCCTIKTILNKYTHVYDFVVVLFSLKLTCRRTNRARGLRHASRSDKFLAPPSSFGRKRVLMICTWDMGLWAIYIAAVSTAKCRVQIVSFSVGSLTPGRTRAHTTANAMACKWIKGNR